jgi:hypothetical protein
MKTILAATLILFAPTCLRSQPVLPDWLATYPGANVTLQKLGSMVAASFSTAASPDQVREHYRQAFEAEGLPFAPFATRLSTTIHSTAVCDDLLISIQSRGTGSAVRVSCTSKLAPAKLPPQSGSYQQNVANMTELHNQRVAEMGIHRQRQDAPAPVLNWPDWLVHVKGSELAIEKGLDPAGNGLLKTRYITTTPMSELFVFYKQLLTANGFQVNKGMIGTGQTTTGIQQNAHGYVESTKYPDGFPGPHIEVDVRFSRTHLNDPITVDMQFVAYAYHAPASREP